MVRAVRLADRGRGVFTALGWRAFTLVGSSRLGIVFLAQAIGLLTTLLIGGALADRIPRRTMMIASDLSRCVAMIGATMTPPWLRAVE